MKRLLLLLVLAGAAAIAIPYAWRLSHTASTATVTSLLPPDTIAFAHMPHFLRTRDEWYRSDVYQLYAEPSVQEFLRKPLGDWSDRNRVSQRMRELEELDPKDAFIALIPSPKNPITWIVGFRYRGKQEAAEQIIGGWRTRLGGVSSRRETIEYHQHKIDLYDAGTETLADTYDRDWFFASNDLEQTKAVLDRANGQATAAASPAPANTALQSLNDDDQFHAAARQVPSGYALGFYAQPKQFAAQVASVASKFGATTGQQTALDQIHSLYATTRFDSGKIHDVIFVGMPRSDSNAVLNRDSLTLATTDTIVYVASLLNFSKQLALLTPGNQVGGILGSGLDKIASALARAKIDIHEWNQAFGDEAGLIGDWSKNAHWPAAVAAFSVKDRVNAQRLAAVLAHASDHDAIWRETDTNGVHYITMQSAPGFLILRPTIAISDRVMIVGLDPGSVETVMQRSQKAGTALASSGAYKRASAMVPAPTNFFAYVDLARLYTRFDETLRPILIMWAAFMPGINNQVDLNRIPSPEVVAKHLTPIVSSQRYSGEGYVTESIGPLTLNQSGLALLALGAFSFKSGIPSALGWTAPTHSFQPRPMSPIPSAQPSSTPGNTP